MTPHRLHGVIRSRIFGRGYPIVNLSVTHCVKVLLREYRPKVLFRSQWDCWKNIIGRHPRKDDAVWIPNDKTETAISDTGQVLPLDKRSYWVAFNKRATQAGHPRIAADSFTRQRHH